MFNKLNKLEEKLAISHSKFIAMEVAVLICLPLFALDLISKGLMEHFLKGKESVTLIKNFMWLELVYNKGCFMGWGSNSIPAHIVLILISILGAVAIIFILIKKYKTMNNWMIIGLGLMLPGDLGNLVDRVMISKDGSFRGVIDFISINLGFMMWPNFNLADALLVAGIIVLAVGFMLVENKKDSENQKANEDALKAAKENQQTESQKEDK